MNIERGIAHDVSLKGRQAESKIGGQSSVVPDACVRDQSWFESSHWRGLWAFVTLQWMQRINRRIVPSFLAVLLLLALCCANNLSVIEQGISLICHQVLGMKDLDHHRNHGGAGHQHRHPGEKQPHKHGDPAQAFVYNTVRFELEDQAVAPSGLISFGTVSVTAIFLLMSKVSRLGLAGVSVLRFHPPGYLPWLGNVCSAAMASLSLASNAPPRLH